MLDALTKMQSVDVMWPRWTDHKPNRMARDFLLWRHLRVVRARVMRHIHSRAEQLFSHIAPRPMRTSYGVTMLSNWNDRTYAYCHYGTYGSYLSDLIHSLDRPFLFLDIGANQGLFSLIAAQNPSCEAIVALEPVPSTYALLLRNLALSGVMDRAVALNFGLSDQPGPANITIDPAHSGVATLEAHLQDYHPDAAHIPVEMQRMDGLDAHLPAHLPIFVKVDVEGHEAVVIDQLLASPHASRVIGIFYEYDARWCDGARIEQSFARAGLTTLRRYGRGRHFDALAVPTRPAGLGDG